MPKVYLFPTSPKSICVDEGGLAAWSNVFGFIAFEGCSRFEVYDTGVWGYGGRDRKTNYAELYGYGSSVISMNGEILAPNIPNKKIYESALKYYLNRFPDRHFGLEKVDVVFFPGAVDIVYDDGSENSEKKDVFHYSLIDHKVDDLESFGLGVSKIFPSGVAVYACPSKKNMLQLIPV